MDARLSQSREIFQTWAPSASIWSQWAKPVLFAQLNPDVMDSLQPQNLTPNWDMSWLATVDRQQTAIIVNLPDIESVAMGLKLAQNGYQPVPLYNGSDGPGAVVPVDKIQAGLVHGAQLLQGLSIDFQAPPAFLIDSNRLQGVVPPAPGRFDNRWVVFPQDLPSGTFLGSRGITQVIVIQHDGPVIQEDLAATLQRWAKSGISLLAKDPTSTQGLSNAEPPMPARVPRMMGFGLWIPTLWLLSRVGGRSNVGGFGMVVPDTTRGSTFG